METDRFGSTYDKLNLYLEDGKTGRAEKSWRPDSPIKSPVSQGFAGHGGSDFYTMHFFLEAIRTGQTRYLIDVYQAADMTLPGYWIQVDREWEYAGGDSGLRKKSVREQHRNDNWCLDPKLAGPGQPKGSCREEREGRLKIAASVYRKTAAAAKNLFK